MSAPRATTLSDGGIRLENIAPWFVQALLEVPSLLAPNQSASIDQRLFPDPSDDEQQRKEWRDLVHPELFALFASAREIVATDLAGITPEHEDVPFGPWSLTIPGGHVDAWMSALNAARLTIGEIYRIEEGDMLHEDDDDEQSDDDDWIDEMDSESEERQIKRYALTKIHLLGWIQQLLIEEHWPSPEPLDDREPDPDQEG